MAAKNDYLQATRHPWPCLLFVAPLLAAYEIGVHYLSGNQPEMLRNGADSWMRQGLGRIGMHQQFWAPLCLLGVLLIWNIWRWADRPGDLVGTLTGMVLESVGFALGLWGLSRVLGPLVDYFGLELSVASNAALGQVVTFLGAGIYEELLFRLLLFSGLIWFARRLPLPNVIGVMLAAAASAVLFSAAHHVGPYGEPLVGYTFLFRTVAGLYFSFLYLYRGFGVTVGAHACYDVIVGVVAV